MGNSMEISSDESQILDQKYYKADAGKVKNQQISYAKVKLPPHNARKDHVSKTGHES